MDIGLIDLSFKKELKGFSLDVQWKTENGITVLFGPSGSGKSMTLECIAGFVQPNEGYLSVEGRALFDGKKGIRISPQNREIGYVFQNYALFPHLNLLENILFGHEHPKSAEALGEADRFLFLFHLKGLELRYPAELSGGEQQRVALIRALLRRPKVLLLDEPFASVGLIVRRNLRAELKEFQRRLGVPMVMVTHDLSEALMMADQLILYYRGKAIQQGTPQEIINHPADENIAEMMEIFSIKVSAGISF